MISQFQLHMCKRSMLDKLQHGILNQGKKTSLFNYFHSKVFFLILVHVCCPFRKYVTLIECLCKYSNHCLIFLNREYIFYSAQYIFRKYWKEKYTLCQDNYVEKEVACANFNGSSILTVKIGM